MADQNQNANSSDGTTKKSSGASPWDDELDLPPEKPEKKQQPIIGSLNPEDKPEEKPVPFNIPEEVIEEKVAKPVAASEVMGKDKPISYPAPMKHEPKASKIATKPVPTPPPSEPNHKVSPASNLQLKTEPEDGIKEESLPDNPIATVEKKTTNQIPPAPEKIVENKITTETEKKEGISALLLDKKPAAPQGTSESTKSDNKSDSKPAVDAIKPAEKSLADILKDKPLLPDELEKSKPAPAPIVLESPKEPEIKPEDIRPEVNKTQAPAKKGFHLFGHKETVKPADQVEKAIQPSSVPPAKPASNKTTPSQPPVRASHGPSKLAWIFAVLVLLTGAIYLTEIGLFSIGLEKIYGIVGLERLWGGLPRSAEPALAEMVGEQKNHLNFRFSGKITATVDKTKNSPITSPIVAFGIPTMALTDISVTGREKAIITQYDYYDTGDTGDSSSSTDSVTTTDDSSTASDTLNDDTFDDSSVSTDDAGGSEVDSLGEDQSALGSYTAEETTMKQLEFDVSGNSTEDGIMSSLNLKPIVGSTKNIELAASTGKLYIKSSDFKFDQKAVSGKWLAYKFAGLTSENALADFLNIKFDSGFSAKGMRVGNDKLTSGRAYHYQIYNLELGEAFSAIGLPGSVTDSIKADVWIGVRDHLLKKLVLDITPSVSSSINNIKCELLFSDYDSASAVTIPTLDNVIDVANPTPVPVETSPAPVESTEPVMPTPTPITTSPVDSSSRTADDARRHSDLLAIKTALNSYKSAHGRYPVSIGFSNLSASGNILSSTLIPKYLSSLPTDPTSGWWYGYKSDGRTFTLSARFENIYDTEVTEVNGIYLHYVWSWR